MRKRRHVIARLCGLALALAVLTSAADAQTAAPKRNGKIAFAASGIWVMNPDGSDRRRLTDSAHDFLPSWSPDGTQIAYVKSIQVGIGRWANEIWLMNADGSNQRRLTQPGVAIGDRPAWSPDGSKIAFTGFEGSRAGILYLINADGSGQRSIGVGWSPDWSPDGTKLVVDGLYVLNADGSGRTPLTTPRNPSALLVDYDWGPAWSPDGTRIIFNRTPCDSTGDNCESTTIWTVSPDGSGLAKLADNAAGFVDWSPDGSKIVFANDSGDLFVMSVSCGVATNVTNTPGLEEYAPSWQPIEVPPGSSNPIDDPAFFVRQQYLDFLNREPDAGGFSAWLGVLNSCPNVNAGPGVASGCDRLYVSGEGFFRSVEFSLKGAYVFRLYKAAFNRLPECAEITSDMSFVAGATEQEVFARRAELAERFTGRQEFVGLFGWLTNPQYVSFLLGRYGLTQITTRDPANPDTGAKVTLTDTELADRLGAGTLTRAQVLRAVADSDEVVAAEYNNAFVAMQYYGYLRRKPEPGGYEAWLRVIGQDPTNVRLMVNGFVNSQEYRRRFGPA